MKHLCAEQGRVPWHFNKTTVAVPNVCLWNLNNGKPSYKTRVGTNPKHQPMEPGLDPQTASYRSQAFPCGTRCTMLSACWHNKHLCTVLRSGNIVRRSYSMSGRVSTGMGDRLWQINHLSISPSHSGHLSLLPSAGREMSTSQSAVMLCSWGVKAGMVHSSCG